MQNKIGLNTCFIGLILFSLILGCHREISVRDSIDFWQVTRVIKVFPNSIIITDTSKFGKEYWIKPGLNSVLEFSVSYDPVFKKGKEISDLSSKHSLLIELDNRDSVVKTKGKYFSKAFKYLYAFSPEMGVSELLPADIINCMKITNSKWAIDFDIKLHRDEDAIKYQGIVNIKDTLVITNIYKENK